MHITRVEIENIPPLGNLDVDCDSQVNLFIGPNASGKSTLLRGINSLCWSVLDCTDERIVIGPGLIQINEEEEEFSGVFLKVSYDWPRDVNSNVQEDALPVLYIPATRVSLPEITFPDMIIDTVQDPDTNTPLNNLFDTRSGVFNGYYVELAIRRLGGGNGLNRDQRNQLRRVLDIGYSCARHVCAEVLRDDTSHPFIEIDKASFPERIVHHGMGIGTNDDVMAEPLHASVLSSGTQGTLLWIYALALRMASHYGWEEGWEKKPAILLIDEIENHLHPTWQRRVIPSLLKHFPGLQIFATTHSPFIVAGLKVGQVHLLKRDENGRVTNTTYERDVIGWTADEILRTMMDVDEPTDQLTVDRANRLRQLREKETLTPVEESELNDLRSQVNKDLVSKGGPLEAQRERYAELMERFLLSRQSELTQDGG